MSSKVTLAGGHGQFVVAPGETLLEAGLAAGYALPWGCRSGSCASCRVRLLEGTVRHRQIPLALSQAERDAGYVLMCLAEPDSDLTLALEQPPQAETLRPRRLPARMLSRSRLSDDVLGVTLATPPVNPLRWAPGQYVDVLLPDGRRRSFSVANAPDGSGRVELHVKCVPGGAFADWVQQLPDRAMLRLEGPLGAFWLREDSRRPLSFIAGGTGYAPVRAMLQRLRSRAAERPAELVWGARRRADLYLDAEPRCWQADGMLDYVPVLAEPDAGWTGHAGMVHEVLAAIRADWSGRDIYISGPPAMVQAAREQVLSAGAEPDHLYYDPFDPAHVTWPEAERASAADPDSR